MKLSDFLIESESYADELAQKDKEEGIKFQIYDTKTGDLVGKPYSSRKRAITRINKLDDEYGAARYRYKKITPE